MYTFLSYIYSIYTLYLLIYIYNVTTLLSYYISILYKGSNLLFFVLYLTTLILFRQKSCCTGVFCIVFQCFSRKNRKKSDNFLQFFLSVYQ